MNFSKVLMPIALAFSMTAFVGCDKSEKSEATAKTEASAQKGAAVSAATAVPTAKANEMTNNVSAYRLMQDAYVGANGKFGSFKEIGFEPPKSDTFEYVDIENGIWVKSKIALGSCVAGSVWNMRGSMKGSAATYNCTFFSPENKPCEGITSTFEALCSY